MMLCVPAQLPVRLYRPSRRSSRATSLVYSASDKPQEYFPVDQSQLLSRRHLRMPQPTSPLCRHRLSSISQTYLVAQVAVHRAPEADCPRHILMTSGEYRRKSTSRQFLRQFSSEEWIPCHLGKLESQV